MPLRPRSAFPSPAPSGTTPGCINPGSRLIIALHAAARLLLVGTLAVTIPLATTGCEEEIDVTTEEGLKKALSKKEKLNEAMNQLKTYAGDKEELSKYGAELKSLYMDGSDYDNEVLGYLVTLEDADYEEAYIKALESGETAQIRMAAAPIAKLKLKGAVEALINAYHGTADNEIKRVVMEVGTELKDERFAKLARDLITEKGPADVPIANLRYACRVLEYQQDESAIPALLKASFYSDEAGRTIGDDCVAAILAVGKPAIPEIIKMYKGNNESVNRLVKQYEDRLAPESVQLRGVTLLGKLRAEEARDLLLDNLESPDPIEPPAVLAAKGKSEPADVQAWTEWASLIGQATQETLFALNDIGLGENNERAKKVLMSIYKWEEPYPAKYKTPNDIANMVEISARVNSARVLAEQGYLDDATMQEVLTELKDPDFDNVSQLRPAARASIVTDLVTYLGIASEPGWHDTVWKFFSELSANELAENTIKGIEFDLEPARKRIAITEKTYSLADECGEKLDCYVTAFKEEKEGDAARFRRIKAVYEIGQLGTNEQFDLILDNFVGMDAFGYMFAVEAMARLGTSKDVEKVDAVLDDVREKRGAQTVKIIEGYLLPLKATLANKDA